MKTEINNMWGSRPIEVNTPQPDSVAKFGPHVDLTQRGGSMYFQHSMTSKQARDLAEALIAAADEADELAAQVAA